MNNLINKIKVEESDGLYYVTVYVVYLVTLDGRLVDYQTFFSKVDALEVVSHLWLKFGDKYQRIFCESKLVWLS